MIRAKRIYDPVVPEDGRRLLVDRLWPRGIKKAEARIARWLKEVAPSDGLRKWFKHDSAKWAEFQRRYFEELDAKPEAWEPLLDEAAAGDITLLFSARDTEHNNAVALQSYLAKRARGKRKIRVAS
jgi:uncharacterized protein YeaO (DUF488 family)